MLILLLYLSDVDHKLMHSKKTEDVRNFVLEIELKSKGVIENTELKI